MISNSELDQIQMNFIIGPGRSGTTLLVLILNETQECIATLEIKHFLYFYEKYRKVTVVTEELISDYENYLTLLKQSKQNPLYNDNSISMGTLLELGKPINFSQLTKLIHLMFLNTNNRITQIKSIVDKNPFYTFHTDKVKEVFPAAKFLCMMRDPRAYILSNRQSQKSFIKIKSVFYYAQAWKYHANKIDEILHDNSKQSKLIFYEDLVLKKELTVQEIVTFFGLTYNENLFQFHKTIEEIKKGKEDTIKLDRTKKKIEDLSNPINTLRLESWKSELTQREQKKIEFVLRNTINKMGYKKKHRLTLFEKIEFSIFGTFAYLRVSIFFMLNSVTIHHYLNIIRKAKVMKKIKN
jgi:hypothetical protein